MKIDLIKESYVNISGNIYDSDFINLANIKDGKINFDENTLFLSESKKKKLNEQPIKKNLECIYVFDCNGSYGLVASLPIQEYVDERIKCHELILPDTVQGMIANSHIYNSETAPVLVTHKKKIDLKKFITAEKFTNKYEYQNITLFEFVGDEAKKILEQYDDIETMYVADGHHRLYTTSMVQNKKNILTCFLGFPEIQILPINRVIKNVDASSFEKAKNFMVNMLGISTDEELSKGYVRITYQDDSFLVKLKVVEGDLFWNNDVYRLNTQIISTAFRILNFSNVEYVMQYDLENKKKNLDSKDVLLEVTALSLEEFSELSDSGCILPPKSTCFVPKFPSFLIFNKYR